MTENIFTQADTWEAVRKNVPEAVRGYYFDQPQAPKRIGLHQKICFARLSLEWLEGTQ